jgi:hypothetical protein
VTGALALGEARAACVRALRTQAETELKAGAPAFLERYPLQPYIDELNHHGRPHRFWEFTDAAQNLIRRMSADFPAPMVEVYHRLLLAALIEQAGVRTQHHFPVSVHAFILENFDRILAAMERPRSGYYSREVQLYRRDLAMCRLKFVPCGSEIVDINVGFPRREAIRSIGAFLDYLNAFRTDLLGPLHPVYESHWDRRFGQYFSPLDFGLYYLRIADMMKANPDVRALIAGQGWWDDPALREISPELAYLRETPESGGARFMLWRGDPKAGIQNALAFSPKRKALYDAGLYVPKMYVMVWRRGALLAWAEQNRARLEHEEQARVRG